MCHYSGGEEEKWEAEVERELAAGCSPQRVWEFLGSFSGLHRWLLSVQICQLLEGQDGVPGAIRLCSGSPPGSSSSIWVTEKLLSHNPSDLTFSYSMLDSSYGFQNYISRFSVLASQSSRSSISSHDAIPEESNAIIKWSFELSPVPGRSRADVLHFLLAIFDRMISNLEAAVLRGVHDDAANAHTHQPPHPPQPYQTSQLS